MPYALPTESPSSPLPHHPTEQEQQHLHAYSYTPSQGRSGHRRSYSHTHITPPETTAFTSTSSSLGALPRRRSTASAPSTPGPSVRAFAAGPPGDPSTGASSSSTKKPPTFQLGHDDDEEDSSGEEVLTQRPPKVSIQRDADNDDDEEDVLRRLPPLRLKVKTSPFDTAPTPFSSQLAVPFPRSSPRTSPTHSPTAAPSSVPFPAPGPLHARSISDDPTHPDASEDSSSAATRQLRPSFSRTSSTPILLSNGRPLKSSLKSSSSSPNIPFPPQSLVPSILWPDLHRRPENTPHHHHRLHHPHQHHPPHHLHERAASAPSTPHLGHPPAPPSLDSSQASGSPPPSLSSSITSDATSTPLGTSNANTSEESLSPSPPGSPGSADSSYYYHPPPPKNVHFPSQEDTLATVKVFNRSARPASLSLSRVGEETETETEGEGSSNGGSGLGKWGWGWNGYNGYGFGGYRSASPSASVSAKATAQGYPFPKVARSPLAAAGQEKEKEEGEGGKVVVGKEWFYDVDMEHSSDVPMRGAERADGNVYLESVGFVRAEGSSLTPSRPLTLTGTVLVRNVTYQKTVAVRFTMDDWHTTNDVLAKYERSLNGLPGSVWGRREGRQGEKIMSPYALEPSGNTGAVFGDKPAWDRFRFHINLEDYATSESLEKRTMWLVGRYSAGVAAPSVEGQVGETVRVPGGGLGTVAEWWDNNGGRNYGFGFRRVEREKVLVAVEGRERKDGGFGSSPSGAGYRRGVILSAPSAYSPPPTMQGSSNGKTYAAPQISSSLSFPSGQAQAQAMYNSQHPQSPYTQQQQQGRFSPGLSFQQQPESSPIVYQKLTEQHQQHQAALAHSTLERLKKLNLRNYAAPTSPTALSPSPSTTPTTTATTSAESTPVQTPILDDGGGGGGGSSRNGLPHDHDELAAELGVVVAPSSSDADGSRRGLDITQPRVGGSMSPTAIGSPPSAADAMMGTTPPFSTMGPSSANNGGGGGKGAGGGSFYWPWGSFGDVVGGLGMKKHAQGREERYEAQQPYQEARVPPVSAAVNTANAGLAVAHDDEEDADVASLLENIKERSMVHHPPAPSSSSMFGGPGGVMPPQRKRKDPAHGREGAADGYGVERMPKATFSIGGGGGVKKSSSSSGSGSGSDSAAGSGSGSGSPTTHRGGSAVYRPGLIRNPGGSLLGAAAAGGNSKSSPSAVSSSSFRTSPVPSPPSRSPLGTPTLSSSGFLSAASPSPSPSFTAAPAFTTSPLSSSATTPTAAPASPASPPSTPTRHPQPQKTDDAVYQAFVRQWCFAQTPGPGPTSGTVSGGPGQEGAALQVR